MIIDIIFYGKDKHITKDIEVILVIIDKLIYGLLNWLNIQIITIYYKCQIL